MIARIFFDLNKLTFTEYIGSFTENKKCTQNISSSL